MADKVRIVHYINQFFAGVGGEEEAGTEPTCVEGVVGAAVGLERQLGEAGEVVATIYAGDNHMTANGEVAIEAVVGHVEQHRPDVVVAGPAFGSGRYGMACGAVCEAVQSRLEIPCITAMHEENPAVEEYRSSVVILRAGQTAAGMRRVLPDLAQKALRLGRGEELGSPGEEGYFARGIRRNEMVAQTGASRAVGMLVDKVVEGTWTSELPLPSYDRVEPPPAVPAKDGLLVALVAEGGVVPRGNPDRIPSGWARHWARYPLEQVVDLQAADFESVHGGFDTTLANQDPDRLIPVDAIRALERDGIIRCYDYLYSTTGNMGSIREMERIGGEIAAEVRSAGVEAVIVGST